MEPISSERTSPAIPIAIVAGFAMIALAIFLTGDKTQNEQPSPQGDGTEIVADGTIKPVSDQDYIRGNPNAPILMIEYSDYDCPFCKQYHSTLRQIMDEYGVSGRVAWVYRQFPLPQLHPNAPKISEAALCVGKAGGQEAFWKFSDLIFEERELNEPTSVVRLPEYAVEAGITKEQYISCMDGGEMEAVVKASIADALSIGAQGTPHTVLVVGNQQAVINGAQSYDTVRGIIENLLAQLDGTDSAFTPTEQ